MDIMSKEERSRSMSLIKSRDTQPEKTVRSLLHKMGFRFSLQRKDLPGKPDIVLPKYKTVIFVHGCFWHRHYNCKRASTPKSNIEFWQAKFEANKKRDRRARKANRDLGWNVIIIWECQISKMKQQPNLLKNEILKSFQ